MNKKVWLGTIVVFVVVEILNFLVYGILMMGAYQETAGVWRADMNSKLWILHLITLVTAFFFSWIFSKGYEKKGIMEGLRYGLYMGFWLSLQAAYATYAMVAIPASMAAEWLVLGIVEYAIAGIALAYVFKEKAVQSPA